MRIGSNTLRYTTLPFDVTLDGALYSVDNSLLGIDPPSLSSNTDREAFKITFADPMLTYSGIAEDMIGARISIIGGFYNTSGAPIATSDNVMIGINEPILNSKDCITLYKGFIDITRYNLSEEGGAIFEIECASPMASLDALNSFYTTRNAIKQRVPASEWSAAPDTCFDNVSLGGTAQEMLWGKI